MNRKAFYALLMAMFTTSLGVGLIIPLLPVYAESLGANGFWIGLIFGANPLVRATFTLFVGSLADRREKRGLMLGGLLGYALCSIGFMLSQAPWQLFLARVAQGAFSAMVMPVARAYAGDLAPKGREGAVMGQFSLAFSLGFAFGPLMGGVLADNFGLNAPFVGMSVISLLAWLFVSRFVPKMQPKPGFIVRRGLDLRPFRDRQVVGLVAGRGLVEVGRGIFSTLMPLVGNAQIGLSSSQTGFIVTLRSSMESLIQPVSGRLSDRVNRRTICLVGFLTMPIALLLTPGARSYLALGTAAVILGTAAGIAVPAASAIAVNKGRIYGMGSMMGLDSTAQALGMALGSTVGGTLYGAFSSTVAFRAAAVASLLGATVFAVLTRGYRNESAEVELVSVSASSRAIPATPTPIAVAGGNGQESPGR
jgi:DHA1 family multidrug resistance protein-like MFS transporter